jgi:hypothetical protein
MYGWKESREKSRETDSVKSVVTNGRFFVEYQTEV